jgi:hypothetical protein
VISDTGRYRAGPLERDQAGKQPFLGSLDDRPYLALDLLALGAQQRQPAFGT